MEKTPDCYGEYGTSSCEECECAEWCIDAGDPPISENRGDGRSFAKNFEGFDALDNGPLVGEGSDLSKLLSELIFALDTDNAGLLWDFLATMSALSRTYPSTYRVARMRVLHPSATYQALGDELGLTRQAVEIQLKRCAELVPILKSTLPPPKERLSKSGDAFKIRCSSGFISLFAGDTTSACLKFKQDETNSRTAPLLASALNNMHWRKRDALLEEV